MSVVKASFGKKGLSLVGRKFAVASEIAVILKFLLVGLQLMIIFIVD